MITLPLSVDKWFALPQADYVENVVLLAGVAQGVTKPSGAKFAMFSATGDFWMKDGGTAAVPSSTTTDGTGSELNPYFRKVSGRISLIAEADCKVSISWYG